MERKQINISWEKVLQVTEIFEQEYKNQFGIHGVKEELVNIISEGALDDAIPESILNMADIRKSRKEDFR